MLGALHQRLTSPLSLQQGQDAAGSNVELEQAFSRLCVKQQEQQASAASSSEGKNAGALMKTGGRETHQCCFFNAEAHKFLVHLLSGTLLS